MGNEQLASSEQLIKEAWCNSRLNKSGPWLIGRFVHIMLQLDIFCIIPSAHLICYRFKNLI